jgi:hypothetical protein
MSHSSDRSEQEFVEFYDRHSITVLAEIPTDARHDIILPMCINKQHIIGIYQNVFKRKRTKEEKKLLRGTNSYVLWTTNGRFIVYSIHGFNDFLDNVWGTADEEEEEDDDEEDRDDDEEEEEDSDSSSSKDERKQ